VFPGQPQRPGCIMADDDADITVSRFRDGMSGVWGRFTHDQPPTVDLLCAAADNEAQQIILDVRKVA